MVFYFSRRTTIGRPVPSWLSSPGPAILWRRVRSSKYEPLVDEVYTLLTTPTFAYVCVLSGRETTVSLQNLVPAGEVRSAGEKFRNPSITVIQEGEYIDSVEENPVV